MIRIASLAAALALLPLSSALAATDPEPKVQAAEARIEALAEAFEARMEAFGERAEAIAADKALSEAQKEAATATLWATEFQPEVTAFTSEIAEHAGAIAQAALADIDMEALVEEALNSAETKQAMAAADGIIRNSAWTDDDPEQRVTYGLIADYAMTQASDAIAEAYEGVEADEAETPAAPEAPEL